jgi:hypothetical protein
MVFMQKGKEGKINEGENPFYAEDADKELDLRSGSLQCSAEGGAVVAYIVKES